MTAICKVCDGSLNAPEIEAVDVERFPEEDGTWFQISGRKDGNPWLIVNREFVEMVIKMADLKPGELCSIDRL